METFPPYGRRIFARSTVSDVFLVDQRVNRPYYNFMVRLSFEDSRSCGPSRDRIRVRGLYMSRVDRRDTRWCGDPLIRIVRKHSCAKGMSCGGNQYLDHHIDLSWPSIFSFDAFLPRSINFNDYVIEIPI